MQKKNKDQRLLQSLELENEQTENKRQEKNILAIDYGKKNCGLAFSPDGICIVPIFVVNTDKVEKEIEKILNTKSIQKVVIGIPYLASGKENELGNEIRKLAKTIKTKKNIEIAFVNERFSSKNVLLQNKNKKQRRDDLAAMQILKFYLSRKDNKLKLE